MKSNESLKRVLDKLQDKVAEARKMDALKVAVGYSADYALRVHEDMEMSHKEGQSAKFLETPLRAMQDQLAQTVQSKLQGGSTLEQAALAAGQQLLEESQKIVPVDTGNLRDSGYIKAEQ